MQVVCTRLAVTASGGGAFIATILELKCVSAFISAYLIIKSPMSFFISDGVGETMRHKDTRQLNLGMQNSKENVFKKTSDLRRNIQGFSTLYFCREIVFFLFKTIDFLEIIFKLISKELIKIQENAIRKTK